MLAGVIPSRFAALTGAWVQVIQRESYPSERVPLRVTRTRVMTETGPPTRTRKINNCDLQQLPLDVVGPLTRVEEPCRRLASILERDKN